jgi:Immunity protein 49
MATDREAMDQDRRTELIASLERRVGDGSFDDIETAVRHIEKIPSINPGYFATRLASHAKASALFSWFRHNDLESMRQWWYVAAKLHQWNYSRYAQTAPVGNMLELISPLLSNCRLLIQWFADYHYSYDSSDMMTLVEDPRTRSFCAYQAFLALRGEWGRLIERCERVIADPVAAELGSGLDLNEYLFYLALARRQRHGMEEALRHIVEPRAVRERIGEHGGLWGDLISAEAVIYAKIAWYHGYEVQVSSPYVPLEWLPMEPLTHYDNHYRFLT